MTDLSKLSNEELAALYSKAAPSIQDMSDDELRAAHSALPQRGVVDKLFGLTGERYQTWPERAVREAINVPSQVVEAAGSAPPGTREFTENVAPAATQAAMLATPANPGVRAGDQLIPGAIKALRAEKPKVPTAQELMQVGIADKKLAEASNLNISPSAVADFSRQLQQELFQKNIHPSRAAGTYEILREIESAAPNASSFTAANLQTLREHLQAIAQNFNPQFAKDQAAASAAIQRFDDFLPQLSPKDVVAGATSSAPATREQLVANALGGKREAERVHELFSRGRENMAAAFRSNDITGVLNRANTGILGRAEGRAQAANSGRNLDNTIRSKVESVLEKPKEVSGLSDAEIAALEGVVQGGAVRNTARTVGNWLGGGGGLGQTSATALGAAVGATAGGVPGAMVGAAVPLAAGTGARSVANVLARRDLNKADELMRMRSPLYKEREANPDMAVISPEKRAFLLRLLAMEQQAQ